ncbi:DDB1- and CUL4-associated factor 8 isoform X2 [Solenopsis invicta]|uniref:DDB1- and CUL4-associated factor 8 isoform X2 n=1 Tax=Solenopsis invicta TaxID=13686 RepID=UPI000595A6D4|nr:DDB1- and CUL4-associated factor 8 isoform X2 [Solenopsis invicta]XP_039313862.1 DDB1- and CUL4-associated factor 8 isoform X2 [Solenopsis invicta]
MQPPNWHGVQEGINRQIERLSLVHQFTADEDYRVTTLSFNQEGNLLANACKYTSKIFIWNWAVSEKHCFESGHTISDNTISDNTISDVKWLPLSTEYLVTCARDDGVRLLNLNSKISEILAVHDYQPEKLAVHPEIPNTVLTAGREGKVVLIDVREKTGNELLTVFTEGTESKINLPNIHFNPLDSYEFCVSGYCQYVRVYDRRQVQQPLYTLCPDHLRAQCLRKVLHCVYNHDGKEIVASYGQCENIYLINKRNSSSVKYVHIYQDAEEVIFFGPKSEYVISGSRRGYLFIWDKNTQDCVKQLECEGQFIRYLKAHPSLPILAIQMDNDIGILMP